jgi:sigma-B regulation protein RsbU (phosphoserine phosphatase)
MIEPMERHCEVCDGILGEDRLRAGPLKKVCLECLSDEERDALQHDLDVASQIQSQLLPARNFSFGRWQIHYHYEPLGIVSGDHIDLIRPGRTGKAMHFLFGDVSGKGVAASILMANLQALFRSLVSQEMPLAEIMERANSLFHESTAANSYATLVAGRLNSDGHLEFANAGHNPPLLVSDRCVTPLDARALPFGLSGDTRYEPESLDLEPQDFLFFYTDGISESLDNQGNEYGASRIETVLESSRGRAAQEVVQSVLGDVERFQAGTPQVDDATAMAIRWRG